MPEALTWVGLTPEVAGLKTALFVGLHLFDEMLTEAAALELREKIVAQIPKSLVLTREDPWYATAQERNYRNGSDVVAELLGGQSALAVITSDNPLKKLVVGIEVRLSASAAQTVLDLLLDNSKFYGDSNLQLSSSVNSPWAALSGRLRYLMVEDDKAKRRAQAKARRAD